MQPTKKAIKATSGGTVVVENIKINVMKIAVYRGCNICVRRIGKNIFEYFLVYNGEFYYSHIIVSPAPGKNDLTKGQAIKAAAVTFTAATVTIDELLKKAEGGNSAEMEEEVEVDLSKPSGKLPN